MSTANKTDATRQKTNHRTSEWIIIGISAVVIVVVVGYLVFEMTQPRSAYVPVDITPQRGQIHKQHDGYVLPIKVVNQGKRTLSRWRGRSSHYADGREQHKTLQAKYLTAGSGQMMYLHFEHNPRQLNIQFKTQTYQLK